MSKGQKEKQPLHSGMRSGLQVLVSAHKSSSQSHPREWLDLMSMRLNGKGGRWWTVRSPALKDGSFVGKGRVGGAWRRVFKELKGKGQAGDRFQARVSHTVLCCSAVSWAKPGAEVTAFSHQMVFFVSWVCHALCREWWEPEKTVASRGKEGGWRSEDAKSKHLF